jgi:hypothetical protein
MIVRMFESNHLCDNNNAFGAVVSFFTENGHHPEGGQTAPEPCRPYSFSTSFIEAHHFLFLSYVIQPISPRYLLFMCFWASSVLI